MDEFAFRQALNGLGMSTDAECIERFRNFEEELYAANEHTNLTRVRKEECWVRHLVDSLLMQDLIPFAARVLDLGTGPGFPAWPLACARPDLSVTALDSSGKMLGFLKTQALPNMVCIEERAESWGVRDAFDVVTGRAVAPLPIQLELSAAPCRLGGLVIPMRTPSDIPAVEALDVMPLGLRLRDVVRRVLPQAEAERAFPVYEKVKPTPARYPRSWAEIKKRAFGS